MELGKVVGSEGSKSLAALKSEIRAARDEAFERSMLQAVKERIEAGQYKSALSILAMHEKRFPGSAVVKSELREKWIEYLTKQVNKTRAIKNNGQVDIKAFESAMLTQ